ELLERLRTKNHRCRISKAYQMDDQVRITVVGLLNLPFMEGMKLDHTIDGYVVQLHELHGRVHRMPLAHPSNSLIAAIKQGIRQQIESQQFPSMAKLATDLGKSRQALYRHFSKQERQSVKAYMTQTVMEEALWRLREQRLPSAAVAYGLGYAEQSSFNHQFKNYYGITPTEAQEAVEVPKPRKGKKFV
ncbi:helix-turn-helix domain-containing protein, partial [Parapedobacter tibetensis]|uniref:helix-turn-helix domain-containing protein n=1 Tax=Parapedobacter tibetensis TaxID=2972951 RepID=UPI00214DE039